MKHKVHNWLKEEEKEHKRDHSSRSSTRSSSSKSKSSTLEKASEEKLRVAELIAEASFMKKKRDAEYRAEALRMEEELAKARARPKVYNDMEGINLGIERTQKYFCQSLKIMKLPYQMCQKEWHLRKPNQDNLGIGHYTLR